MIYYYIFLKNYKNYEIVIVSKIIINIHILAAYVLAY